MIRQSTTGRYYCDGRECGYPLAWSDCDPEDGADGMWTCLDCGAGMYAAVPSRADVSTTMAVLTGAPVVLTICGEVHPPVSVTVGGVPAEEGGA